MIHVLPLRKLIRNKAYHYFLSCLRNVKIRRSVSFIKMDSPPNCPRNRKKAHQMPDCKCDDKSALHAYLESMHSRMLYIPNYNNGLNKGNRIFIILPNSARTSSKFVNTIRRFISLCEIENIFITSTT